MYTRKTPMNSFGKATEQPEYLSYCGMKQRCTDPNQHHYARYGGRGITVCKEWTVRLGFWQFLEDIGRRPSPNHTIERINNDGNYEPGNVKWATYKEQARNRRVRKDNKVGVSGVTYDKTAKRWVVRKTNMEGRRICLGYFRELEDAQQVSLSYGLL